MIQLYMVMELEIPWLLAPDLPSKRSFILIMEPQLGSIHLFIIIKVFNVLHKNVLKVSQTCTTAVERVAVEGLMSVGGC